MNPKNSHTLDKILSFLLVLVGLASLEFGSIPSQAQFIPIVVIIGGVLGIVNSQVMSLVVQMLEKYNVPLATTSAPTSSTTSQGVLHTGSSSVSEPAHIPSLGMGK